MRHLYECPVRWADLDLLGHINNVTYVDYLQEARIDMLGTHEVTVLRNEVRYLIPLTFRTAPVQVECWVTEIREKSFLLACEIFDDGPAETGPESRVVYVRALTEIATLPDLDRQELERFLEAEAQPGRPAETAGHGAAAGESRRTSAGHFPVRVRRSDVDGDGCVSNVKHFEIYQEARIVYFMNIWRDIVSESGEVPLVVAQIDIDYGAPMRWRPETYDVWSWVSHVGNSSFVVESEVIDGDLVVSRARVVLVTFDQATQKAAPAPEEYRQVLQRELTCGVNPVS